MRMFPIQGAEAIPWAVIEPCDRQCQCNHGRQTLEQIAKRGGLGPSEACDVLLGQRWNTTPVDGAADRLREIVKKRWYLPIAQAAEKMAEAIEKEQAGTPRGVGSTLAREVLDRLLPALSDYRKATEEEQ